MRFLKQCKGKDLDKVAKSKLDEGYYFTSKKYDGNYVQIHKYGHEVTFYSSGGIPFKMEEVEKLILEANPNENFVLEVEYIGLTDGSLGSRDFCSTTSFRSKTGKGIKNINLGKVRFKVFDILYYHNLSSFPSAYPIEHNFSNRLMYLTKLGYTENMELVKHTFRPLDEALMLAREYVNNGGEGLFAIKAEHEIREGKRVNDAIKLKFYPRKEMLCVDASFGTGKYQNVISSLKLVDLDGTEVNVGGVIVGEMNRTDRFDFIGSMVLVEYESFSSTYVQPRIKEIR